MSEDDSFEIPLDRYMEEKDELLTEQRADLLKKLKKIHNQLEKSKDIDEFLVLQMIRSQRFSGKEIKNEYQKCKVKFLIKILGTAFVLFHLTAVFELNGILNSIKAELLSSALSYLLKRNREKEDNYYSSYMKISNKIPSFSLFFLSSILSHCLENIFGFTILSIIVLIVNDLNIYLGLNNFDFLNFSNINNENTAETNYSLKKFFLLLVIFLVFYISLGIVALLPLEIVQNGFLVYEEYKENKDFEEFKQFIENDDLDDSSEDYSLDNIINKKEEKDVNNNDNEKKYEVKELVNKLEEQIGQKNSNIIKKDNINKDDTNNFDINNDDTDDKNNINKNDINKDKINRNDMNKDDMSKDDKMDLLNENNNKDIIINDDKKSNENDRIRKTKPVYQLKGYFRFYLLSISLSIILKLSLNRIFVPEYTEENKEKSNFIFILIYSISTILSLIFYGIFSTVFNKKEKKKKIYSSMRFAGYIIYKEEIIREETGLIKNCWDIIKQLNHACCCYLCSFTYIVK